MLETSSAPRSRSKLQGKESNSSLTTQEWAEWFKSAYQEVLNMTPETITPAGTYWLQDALEVYALMDMETKAILRKEGAILAALKQV